MLAKKHQLQPLWITFAIHNKPLNRLYNFIQCNTVHFYAFVCLRVFIYRQCSFCCIAKDQEKCIGILGNASADCRHTICIVYSRVDYRYKNWRPNCNFFFRPIFRWDQASISHLSTKLFQIHHKPFFRRNKYFDRLFIDFFKVRGEFIEKKMRIYR